MNLVSRNFGNQKKFVGEINKLMPGKNKQNCRIDLIDQVDNE